MDVLVFQTDVKAISNIYERREALKEDDCNTLKNEIYILIGLFYDEL